MEKFTEIFCFNSDKGISLVSALLGSAVALMAIVVSQKVLVQSINQNSYLSNRKEVANIRNTVTNAMSCQQTIGAVISDPKTTPCVNGQEFYVRNSSGAMMFPDVGANKSPFRLKAVCKNTGKANDPVGLVVKWKKVQLSNTKKVEVSKFNNKALDWVELYKSLGSETDSVRCTQSFGGKVTSCPSGFYIKSIKSDGTHICESLLSSDGLGSLGSCAYGQVLRGFDKSGQKICDGTLVVETYCSDPDEVLKGVSKKGVPICGKKVKVNTCTLTDFNVPVNIVAESNTKKRTWYRGNGTFYLPNDASAINMTIIGVHADDNRPYIHINGRLAFNFSHESSKKGASYRNTSVSISHLLKPGANSFSGGVYDRYGAYATLIPVMSGTYNTEENCP